MSALALVLALGAVGAAAAASRHEVRGGQVAAVAVAEGVPAGHGGHRIGVRAAGAVVAGAGRGRRLIGGQAAGPVDEVVPAGRRRHRVRGTHGVTGEEPGKVPTRRGLGRHGRVDRAVATSLPELLEGLARSLRAGLSMRAAIDDAASTIEGPLGRDLATMTLRLQRGASLDQVLGRWAGERRRVPGVVLAGVSMTLAAETGGSIAQAIDGVADTVRDELAMQAEVRSLASQAQASALLVAILPLVFGAVAGLADPQTLSFMTSTTVGRACLVAGVLLDIGGFAWMRRITSRITT